MNKLLSIVVPTKNRYYYLTYLLKYFYLIESDEIELIIQDNSDEKNEKEAFVSYLSPINYLSVKYEYNNKYTKKFKL